MLLGMDPVAKGLAITMRKVFAVHKGPLRLRREYLILALGFRCLTG
jgi:hypothetical protein